LGQLHYLSSFAEVGVSDLDASLRWYEDVLGFRRIATYGDAVHMRRAEGQDILLRRAEGGVTLHMATERHLGGLEGKRIPSDPETVEVRDPDGNVMRVFARQRPGPTR
jgi:catechol 2,3-dioxygenase-like lactoylglutathione lyase family enzyme